MRLKPGQVIGPYKITRFIARGGMGEIYEAFEERLDRRVALKIISGHHEESENYRESLTKEARALAKVNHSNVVSVYAIDSLNGVDFIAMEYIDGIPMSMVTEKFAFDSLEVVDVCMQMLQGLKALHDRKIVHRDIKPSNILLTDQGTIKWADFGLAAVLDQVSQNTVSHLYGTPRYLSPEQLKGMATSFPSDIWCLGLVFYEMFAGQKLIDPKKEMTLFEIEEFIMGLDFEIPIHLRSLIHPEFQSILRQMLSKDLKRRYKTIDNIISDFKNLEIKLAKEKQSKVFTRIRKSLDDYKGGWKLLDKNPRLNEFQKKRLMTLSLRFRPSDVSNSDDTLNLQSHGKELYFTSEALDSAQHFLNRQIHKDTKGLLRKTNGLKENMIIYQETSTGKVQMMDVDALMQGERKIGKAVLKKLKINHLILSAILALIVLFISKHRFRENRSFIQSFIEESTQWIKTMSKKKSFLERKVATLSKGNHSSDTTFWFQNDEPKVKKFALSPPELMLPRDSLRFVIKENEPVNKKKIQFFWGKKKQAKSYEIQVAKTKDFKEVKLSEVVKNTQNWSTQLTPGIYYWRVRVADLGAGSGWSSSRKFDIVTEKF